jgi:hypothetical protein
VGEEGQQTRVVIAGGVKVVGEELLGGTKLEVGSRGSRNDRRRPAPARSSWWTKEQTVVRREQRRWWRKGENLVPLCTFYSRVRWWTLVAWRRNYGWEIAVVRCSLHEEGRRYFTLSSGGVGVRWQQQGGGAIGVHMGRWGKVMGVATRWERCLARCGLSTAVRTRPLTGGLHRFNLPFFFKFSKTK